MQNGDNSGRRQDAPLPPAPPCMLRQLHVVRLYHSCTFWMHANKTDIYPTDKHRWLLHLVFSQNHKAMITAEPRYRFTESRINATSLDSRRLQTQLSVRSRAECNRQDYRLALKSACSYCVQGLKFTSSANHQQPQKGVRQHTSTARSLKGCKVRKICEKKESQDFQ